MPDLVECAERALQNGLPSGDDLAFLALTGKIEGTVRDAVALRLDRDFAAQGNELFVCREHKRCDLAVLDSAGRALLSLEFKDCGSADLREEHAGTTYVGLVIRDLRSAKCPGAKPLAVLTSKAISGELRERHGLKYVAGSRGFAQFCGLEGGDKVRVEDEAERCDAFVRRRLHVLASGHVIGRSRSLDVRVDWWLVDDATAAE